MKRGFLLAVDGVVTLALATAAACGESEGEVGAGGFPTFPEEASFQCASPLPELLGGLRPSTPVDYLELRTTDGPANADAGVALVPGPISTGTPCAETSCREALERATAEGWNPNRGCGRMEYANRFFVYSRGSEPGAAGQASDVAALLAPVDTAEEARAILLATKGIELACGQREGGSGWRKNTDGSWEIIAVYGACPTRRGHYRISAAGEVTVLGTQESDDNCICGRRFEGLASRQSGGDTLGAYLADVAYLEAASVIAFRRFEDELARLGAPRAFLERAQASRADEIRHARMTAWLAKVHGGEVAPVTHAPARERSVFDIALENAVEGCVRETYGALVAAFQAKSARDPELRRAMQIIAVDEARHAQLAHDVARWLEPQLTRVERARIEEAKAEAFRDLEAALATPPAPVVAEAAGVPGPAAARALLKGLDSLANAA